MALPHYCVCLPKRRNDTQTSNSNVMESMKKIELYCLYIVDPGYPATWYLVILLLSFLKFSRPFIFMMIFLAVRSMLGEQGCIFLADFFHFVYKACAAGGIGHLCRIFLDGGWCDN